MLKTNGFRADKMVGALSWIYKKKYPQPETAFKGPGFPPADSGWKSSFSHT